MGNETIDAFWAWVSKAKPELEKLEAAACVEALYDRLSAVHPNLGLEVAHDSRPIEVIFTAYADAELIPVVKNLVSAAPDLGWKIVALRPAVEGAFTHKRDGIAVTSTDVRFEFLKSTSRPHSIGVRLYLPARINEHENAENIIWNLAMMAAGEELASKIDYLDSQAIADVPMKTWPLDKLGFYISWQLGENASVPPVG